MKIKNTLRTLKDLKFKNSFATERDMVNIDELKAEAVKWVKKDIEDEPTITCDMLIDRWMDRFNLTESDLEDKK